MKDDMFHRQKHYPPDLEFDDALMTNSCSKRLCPKSGRWIHGSSSGAGRKGWNPGAPGPHRTRRLSLLEIFSGSFLKKRVLKDVTGPAM